MAARGEVIGPRRRLAFNQNYRTSAAKPVKAGRFFYLNYLQLWNLNMYFLLKRFSNYYRGNYVLTLYVLFVAYSFLVSESCFYAQNREMNWYRTVASQTYNRYPGTQGLIVHKVFLNFFKEPRIDSKESFPPAYVVWRASTSTDYFLLTVLLDRVETKCFPLIYSKNQAVPIRLR